MPVLWTAWGRDWVSWATPTSVVATVQQRPASGATVLLHDSDCTSSPGSWQHTLAALPQLIAGWEDSGLEVGPVSEHGVRLPQNKGRARNALGEREEARRG